MSPPLDVKQESNKTFPLLQIRQTMVAAGFRLQVLLMVIATRLDTLRTETTRLAMLAVKA